jgi:hypothetical protein
VNLGWFITRFWQIFIKKKHIFGHFFSRRPDFTRNPEFHWNLIIFWLILTEIWLTYKYIYIYIYVYNLHM